MVRAALSGRTRIGREPAPYAPYVPAATVVVGSLLAALPIISMSGWYPDFGFVVRSRLPTLWSPYHNSRR